MVTLLPLLASQALACAVCGAGDPTITVMGAERPRQGNVRLSTELRYRYERAEDHAGRRWTSDELRLALGAAWSPTDRWVLAAMLPLATASLRGPDLSEARGLGLGDLELRARVVLARDARYAPRHLGGLAAGVEAPTAARVLRDGAPAVDDAQVGTGAWTPSLGLWHSWFAGAWSGFSGLTGKLSSAGWDDRRPGAAALGTVAVQWQPHPNVGGRVGLDARWLAPDQVAGVRDDTTGGWLLAATPALLVRAGDVSVVASVGIPFAQRLAEDAREGVAPALGVIVDL